MYRLCARMRRVLSDPISNSTRSTSSPMRHSPADEHCSDLVGSQWPPRKSTADDDATVRWTARIAQINATRLKTLALGLPMFLCFFSFFEVWRTIGNELVFGLITQGRWANALGLCAYLRELPLHFNVTCFTCNLRMSITLWTSTNQLLTCFAFFFFF